MAELHLIQSDGELVHKYKIHHDQINSFLEWTREHNLPVNSTTHGTSPLIFDSYSKKDIEDIREGLISRRNKSFVDGWPETAHETTFLSHVILIFSKILEKM